jgi:hypothetical protein
MATVHSTVAGSVSAYDELVSIQCAYSAVLYLLGDFAGGHVDRHQLIALLAPLTDRLGLICERIEIEGGEMRS